MATPITLVLMIWRGARGYTLAHAAAVLQAVGRQATFAYRPVILSDQVAPARFPYPVRAFPAGLQALTAADVTMEHDYPKNWAKLWLFSADAQQLGPRICYLDADTLVRGDLAPLVAYAAEAPFVGMRYRAAHKLCTAMFCLQTGALPDIWTSFLADTDRTRTDQGWLRKHQLSLRYPCWDNDEMGIYMLQDIDRPGRGARLPADARIVHPTGKTKPWHPRFLQRHPWAQEYYPWHG